MMMNFIEHLLSAQQFISYPIYSSPQSTVVKTFCSFWQLRQLSTQEVK